MPEEKGKITLTMLDAMSSEDLKVLQRATRMVLALRGEGPAPKKKKK